MPLFSLGASTCARKIMERLNCPCKYFPVGKSVSRISSEYEEAFAERESGHFTPVLVVPSEELLAVFEAYDASGQTYESFSSVPLADAQAQFVKGLSRLREEFGDTWNEIAIDMEDPGTIINKFTGFYDSSSKISPKSTAEVILAKIPTDKPWEIFAWLPFGGRGSCPDNITVMSISKYWFEKYGAVPAVITCDTLEFAAAPVRDRSAAVGLALEHFAFCPDFIYEIYESFSPLASTLMRSTVWSFTWWDMSVDS